MSPLFSKPKNKPRLLIVDDEVHILSALRRSLRREGYEIQTAGSGIEALALLKEAPVDLILSDHMMPRMNGVEFLRQAAALCPDCVRVLFTGWTESISEKDLAKAGIAALVQKPWDDGELKATLRAVCAS